MCAFSISERPPPDPRSTPTTDGRLPGTGSTTVTSHPTSRNQEPTKRAIAPSPAPPGTRSGFTDSIATSSQTSFSSPSISGACLAHEDDREGRDKNRGPDAIPTEGRPEAGRHRGARGGARRVVHRLRQADDRGRQVREEALAHNLRGRETRAAHQRQGQRQPPAVLARRPPARLHLRPHGQAPGVDP